MTTDALPESPVVQEVNETPETTAEAPIEQSPKENTAGEPEKTSSILDLEVYRTALNDVMTMVQGKISDLTTAISSRATLSPDDRVDIYTIRAIGCLLITISIGEGSETGFTSGSVVIISFFGVRTINKQELDKLFRGSAYTSITRKLGSENLHELVGFLL